MTDEKLTPIEIDYPEAPASINFYVVDRDGFNYQITLRDAKEAVLMRRTGELKKWLIEKKFLPKAVGLQPEASVSPNTAELPPMDLPFAESPPPPTTPLEDLFFDAVSMAATVESGKEPRWKVKGGKYMEWGVTIWPEVLEAAGMKDLDPSQVYNLEGYTAYYEPNEKGNPKKVVNLAK